MICNGVFPSASAWKLTIIRCCRTSLAMARTSLQVAAYRPSSKARALLPSAKTVRREGLPPAYEFFNKVRRGGIGRPRCAHQFYGVFKHIVGYGNPGDQSLKSHDFLRAEYLIDGWFKGGGGCPYHLYFFFSGGYCTFI